MYWGMYLLNHTVVISKQGKRGESGIFSLPETTCKLLQPALRIVIIYHDNDKRLKKGVHPAHSDLILRILCGKYMTFLASFRHSKRKYLRFFSIIKVSPKSWTCFFQEFFRMEFPISDHCAGIRVSRLRYQNLLDLLNKAKYIMKTHLIFLHYDLENRIFYAVCIMFPILFNHVTCFFYCSIFSLVFFVS